LFAFELFQNFKLNFSVSSHENGALNEWGEKRLKVIVTVGWMGFAIEEE
jgi:hypothetical protein